MTEDFTRLMSPAIAKGECSTLHDPFQKHNFEQMMIIVHNDREMRFYSYSRFEARIKFKNGDTTGEHMLKADTLEEICEKIGAFGAELDARKESFTRTTAATSSDREEAREGTKEEEGFASSKTAAAASEND